MSHFMQDMKNFQSGLVKAKDVGMNVLGGTTWGFQKASAYAGDMTYKAGGALMGMVGNNAQMFRDNLTFKSIGRGAIFSLGMYGLSAAMTDNPMNAASDRMVNAGKHTIAAGADITADVGLSAAAYGLSALGPVGVMAGSALMAYNFLGNFVGLDAGSLSMNIMNQFDERYENDKRGPKFNMTQNTSMAMQRQVNNLHGAGSNLGEMMHN